MSKSLRHLATALGEMGHRVSHETVGALLRELGYRLQANRKGAGHSDRDAQFEYINARVKEFQAAGQPVISVDTKKKAAVGDFKIRGREYRPRGAPGRRSAYQTIGQLIAATTTGTGLKLHCELDTNTYAKGIVASDQEMAARQITRAEFHGDWNYTHSPR